MNKNFQNTFLIASLFFLAMLPAKAMDFAVCKKNCGMSYGKCIQANPDRDAFQITCTPKWDACLGQCSAPKDKANTELLAKSKKLSTPSRESMQFLEAFMNKNYEMMEMLLQQGANINCENCIRDGYGKSSTPLMLVSSHPLSYDGLSMVDFLLAHGADINYQNKSGETALMSALNGFEFSQHGIKAKIASKLIDAGARVDLINTEGNKAIHILVKNSVSEYEQRNWLLSLNLLLEKGANINEKDGNDMTPLMVQASNCNPGVVEELVRVGADRSIKSRLGETALSLAINKAAKNNQSSACNQVVKLLRVTDSAMSKPGVRVEKSEVKPKDGLWGNLKAFDDALQKLKQ